MKIQINILIDSELRDRLDDLVLFQGTSYSEEIVKAIEEYLESHERVRDIFREHIDKETRDIILQSPKRNIARIIRI